MALLVWLPLNEDLHDQGLKLITVVNNGATVDNNGKLGKCYSFNGSSNYLRFLYPASNLQGLWSFSCWVKCNNFNSNLALLSSRKAVGAGVSIFIISGKIRFDNGSDSTNSLTSFTTSLTGNTWQHITLVQTTTKRKFYLNGILKETLSGNALTSGNTAQYMIVGASSNADAVPTGNWFNGYLNDIRIYNHALSPLEVKEIALGLILHYKMDENINILNNCYSAPTFNTSNANGGWSHWGGTGHSGHYGLNTDKLYIYNKNNIYSHWISDDATATARYLCYLSPAFDGGYRSLLAIIKEENGLPISETIITPNWNGRNGGVPSGEWTSIIPLEDNFYLCKCEGISLNGSDDLIGFSVYPGYKVYISEAYCENDTLICSNILPLFLLDKIIDSSGYNHHGTIVGNVLTVIDNKSRYNKCIYIPSADDYIVRDSLNGEIHTIACWAYIPNDTNYHIICADNNSKISIGLSASNTLAVHQKYSSKIALYWNRSDLRGKWSHFVVTVDNYVYELYINGEKQTKGSTGDGWNSSSVDKLYLGRRYYTSGSTDYRYSLMGNISDFRVYATILDENAIKNLYNVSMKMDNLNNIHTFKIEELNLYSRELIADELLYTPYSSTTTPWTGYNENGEIYMTGTCSLGTRKTILINPNGHSFYYDFTISANVGNYIFLLFSRYDEDYTLRTNDATISIYAGKLTVPINHKRIQGIVDLSTDGINPCKYIRFRVFCGYNGYEGDNPYLIIHSMSLREVKTTQTLKILKNGIFLTDTITEDIGNILFKKLGMTYANEFIER